MNILIVEDEPQLRDFYVHILKAKHDIHAFGSPAEAFRYYVHNSKIIDLVIVDNVMPHRDGKSLIFDMKNINPQQRIVMISGWPVELGLPAGMDIPSFSKPISMEELSQIVAIYGRA